MERPAAPTYDPRGASVAMLIAIAWVLLLAWHAAFSAPLRLLRGAGAD